MANFEGSLGPPDLCRLTKHCKRAFSKTDQSKFYHFVCGLDASDGATLSLCACGGGGRSSVVRSKFLEVYGALPENVRSFVPQFPYSSVKCHDMYFYEEGGSEDAQGCDNPELCCPQVHA